MSGNLMKTIIQREILANLQSLQFFILMIISILLFAVSSWVYIERYQGQEKKYNETSATLLQNASTCSALCLRSPAPLGFLADGGLKNEPSQIGLGPKHSITERSVNESNFKMIEIPEMDWAFIIKVVFSLYVILLAFNAISGEKERGTLRQISANSIGRIHILTAKYISIIITISIPLIAGMLISLLFFAVFSPVLLSLANLGYAVLALMLSLIFLSIFILMSLFVSSLIPRSSLVLLILLSLWIGSAFIIPDLAGILSEKLAGLPSEHQSAMEMGPMIQKEVWQRISSIRERVNNGEFENKEEILAETDAAFEEAQIKVRAFFDNFRMTAAARSRMSRNISRISPASLFQYASESLADTGPERQAAFMEDIRRYSEIYDNWVMEKMGKVVSASNYSFGTGLTFKGEYVDISSPRPEEYEGDKSDMPVFQESRPSLAKNLRNALLDLAGLLLWNLVMAVAAFAAFLRMDVR
jgi:ABC-type transport system involved in multi-copper enzyme maturation permease subunit